MLSYHRGKPIAELNGLKTRIIGIVDDESSDSEDDDLRKGLECKKNESVFPIVDLKKRFIIDIAGPSGSGKSTIMSRLAELWQKMNPKKKIYFFGRCDIKKDPAFNNLKGVIQITLDESLIEDPIDITSEIDEQGCLMIFDDCLSLTDDKLRKEIEKLIIECMEIGRKLNCNMLISSHLVNPNDKKLGRSIMNEITALITFPKSGSAHQIKYALNKYWGLNKNQIQKILELNSRWVLISKGYPMYVIYDKGCYIL